MKVNIIFCRFILNIYHPTFLASTSLLLDKHFYIKKGARPLSQAPLVGLVYFVSRLGTVNQLDKFADAPDNAQTNQHSCSQSFRSGGIDSHARQIHSSHCRTSTCHNAKNCSQKFLHFLLL